MRSWREAIKRCMVAPMRTVTPRRSVVLACLVATLVSCGDSTGGVTTDGGDASEVDAGDGTALRDADGVDADEGVDAVADSGADGAGGDGGVGGDDVGDASVDDGAREDADAFDEGDAIEEVDAVEEVAGDVVSAEVLDAAAETVDAEVLPAVLTCPVASMETLYAGFLPPNPYAAWPAAPDCVRQYHDVIIVLGCPSEGNGSPANCQTSRVDIAMRLKAAGYGDRFIVTGGAVHNQWVEAEALRALLLSRGVANDRIWLEPQAEHTDENLYYSTQIMVTQGWRSALVVSNDPGHLMMTALCDSNCCVELGRLTLFAMPVTGGLFPNDNVGHYVLIPPAQGATAAECTTIQGPIKFMCTNLGTRKACKANFQL